MANDGPLFRKVCPVFWEDVRKTKLSLADKAVALYLFTNEHCNRIGFYKLGHSTAAEDLNVKVEVYKKHLKNVLDSFRWRYDDDNRCLFIRTWFLYNPPGSYTHLIGWLKYLHSVKDSPLVVEFEKTKKFLPEYASKKVTKDNYSLWEIFDAFVGPKVAKFEGVDKELIDGGLLPTATDTPPAKEKEFSPEIEELYEWGYGLFVEAGHERPKTASAERTQKDSIRKTIDIDKRTIGQIKDVISFANQDEFWRPVLRSFAKVRKNWGSIWPKANSFSGATSAGPPPIDAPLSPEEEAQAEQKRKELYGG